MKIALLSPIAWRTPPRHYGPWERVVSLLCEGLVEKGVDVTPSPYMLFVEHIDRPGVIGPFASALGKANINIAMMQAARKVKGEESMMILNIDSAVDEATLADLRKLGGISNVRVVNM
jgi:L-serine deaminase